MQPLDDSEKFKLRRWRRDTPSLFPPKHPHSFELFVGEGDDADLPVGGQAVFYACGMDVCVLFTGAVADVDRVLHLREAVGQQHFAELGVCPPGFFGVGR